MTEGPKRARVIAALVGLGVVALIVVLALGPSDRLDQPSDVLGSRVPAVTGTSLTGEEYDIDDARGKWVVVNFFATWCPGCVQEHPELVAFDEWATETGEAEVVAIIFNEEVDAVEDFFAERGGSWPVLDESRLPIEFQVSQIPETFLVSPSGQVVQHIQGEVEAASLIAVIEEFSS